MVGSYEILKRLVHSTIQVTNFQKSRLEELIAKEFPFKHSKSLIKTILEFDKEIIKQLQEKEKKFSSITKQEDFENLRDSILSYMTLIWELNYIVHVVERSAREHVIESTVLLLEDLTKTFKNAKFFLIPIFEHNYSYRDLKNYLTKVTEILPNTKHVLSSLPDNLSVLQFPDIYRDNLVANSLLGHEVGHFIDDVFGITEKITPKVVINKEKFDGLVQQVKKEIEIEMKGPLPEFIKLEQVKANLLTQINFSINRWIMELISDLVAFRLCGPVFLFALSEFLLSRHYPDFHSDKYPPASLRLSLLLEEFTDMGFLDNIQEKEDKKLVSELINGIKNYLDTSKTDPNNNIVYNSVVSIKSLIKQEANNYTKGYQYEPKLFGNEVFKLIGKLKEFIPPCEIEFKKPANLVSILNAGMIYRMTWRKNPPPLEVNTSEDGYLVEQIINSLVTKSIELSVIQKKMQLGGM